MGLAQRGMAGAIKRGWLANRCSRIALGDVVWVRLVLQGGAVRAEGFSWSGQQQSFGKLAETGWLYSHWRGKQRQQGKDICMYSTTVQRRRRPDCGFECCDMHPPTLHRSGGWLAGGRAGRRAHSFLLGDTSLLLLLPPPAAESMGKPLRPAFKSCAWRSEEWAE